MCTRVLWNTNELEQSVNGNVTEHFTVQEIAF